MFIDKRYFDGVLSGETAVTEALRLRCALQPRQRQIRQTVEAEMCANLLKVHAVCNQLGICRHIDTQVAWVFDGR